MTIRSTISIRCTVAAFAGLLLAQTMLSGAAHAEDRAALMTQHRGGTMTLSAVSAAGTIDPMLNYTAQYWQVYQMTYDGLVKFKQAGGTEGFKIVPAIAEAMPEVKNDGKTYVFKIRKGIKFSNSKDVTPADVLASFQRIFKVKGPTMGSFYNGIVGADKCMENGDTCTLDGGVIADEKAGTVTINLVAADSEFFAKLAVPHASIVPADTAAKDAGTSPIPGTGAYMIASYNPNEQMVLKRNPYFKEWSADAQPDGYADEIDYKFGMTEEAGINAVINGQVDWMYDTPPADRLPELGSKYAKQVHLDPLAAFWYAPMNVGLPPFNNIKARQALNYAIDRDALVGLFGGEVLAQPSCQILPPDFPGHVDDCLYTKDPGPQWSEADMDKAKQLVEDSGTKGQKVTVIAEDNAVARGIGTYLQSVLSELGYDASMKAISPNIQFAYIQNTNNNVQISVTQWYMDYPAASDFLNVLLSCDSFHQGSDSSINISGYCNKDLDAKMKAAMTLSLTDENAANAEWAKIDKAYMGESPLAPLFTPKSVNFTSARLGNYLFNKQNRWIVSQSWVK
ncbi:ABC transporter substrate-binding protein [Rhizobium paranaense]|uniref:Peptide/nickel transport system substrate-binding protein n=1 Tax=Rhizobium paranaense TaxID=1650438 RepID=A0A7W8XUA6_9HYPH|nr:ABC transporter substrate-binding protein [Rhizobium paranaense]MBB5575535.1 peptide/nickel transport system substrate-binding protein [Rhizobium paranaense]